MINVKFIFIKVPKNAEKITYSRLGFFKKFIEANKIMVQLNEDNIKVNKNESRPSILYLI